MKYSQTLLLLISLLGFVMNANAGTTAETPPTKTESPRMSSSQPRLFPQRPNLNGSSSGWAFAGQPYRIQVTARKAEAKLFDINGNLVWQDLHSVGGNLLSPHSLSYMQDAGAYRLEITDKYNGARGEIPWIVLPPLIDTAADGLIGVSGGEQFPELLTACGVSWRRRLNGWGDTRYQQAFKNGKLNIDSLNHGKYLERKLKINALGCLWAPIRHDQLSDANFPAWKEWWLKEYVIPLVTATHDHIRYWEVYNEPYNIFGTEPRKYFELLKETALAIRKIDPDLKIIGICGPSELGGERFYQEVLRLGAVDFMDAMSLHMNCTGNMLAANPEKRFAVWFAALRNMLRQAGQNDMPIWNTETAVTPAATMYAFPENLEKINYQGQYRPLPREQAAVMARVLTLHYVWNVKAFFQFHPTGTNYGVSPLEFDDAPTAAVTALAACRKMLEPGIYFGTPDLHPRINMYLFRNSDTLVTAACWLTPLRANEKAELALPPELRNNQIFDLFGNPRQENVSTLPLSPEPIYLNLNGHHSDVALMQSLRNGIATIGNDTQVDVSLIPGLKSATAADWSNFATVDLLPFANCGFSDDVAGDREGTFLDAGPCDLRLLPPGDILVNNIPFRIIDPSGNNQFGAIALRGHGKNGFPLKIKNIETGYGDKAWLGIHLLLLCSPGGHLKAGSQLATVEINYADGRVEKTALKYKEDLSDLLDLQPPATAKIGIQLPNATNDRVSIFHKEIKLPRPAAVKSLNISSANLAVIPIIIAITGAIAK